ncbi:MAG: RHS repeat protein, partial [Candidatus Omnitrophica bacterium]|nr:RHS repeat protein [Candidatus Omnitrophota bacterium]
MITKFSSKVLSIALIFSLIFQNLAIPLANAYHTGSGDMHDGTPIGSTTPDPTAPTGEGTNNPNQSIAQCADPVSLYNGEYSCADNADLTIPSRGLNVEIRRVYRNQREINGQFGFGWFLNYYERIKKLDNNNMVITDGETGSKIEYVYDGVSKYTAPAGIFAQLILNANGTYTLTKKGGLKYNFDLNGNLASIVDRNNNQISFSYNTGKLPILAFAKYLINVNTEAVVGYDYQLTTITDPVGRKIALTYNAKGKLSAVTDFAGRKVLYTYFDNGDLKSFQDSLGNITQYLYDAAHNLVNIIDPKGQTYLTNVYQNDKVVSQTHGTGTFKFDYSKPGQVLFTDKSGTMALYVFNSTGNPTNLYEYTRLIRAGDPAFYATSYTYDANQMRTSVVFPKGNGFIYKYDSANPSVLSRGNLLEIRRKANMSTPSDDVYDIVTRFTYEPRFDQVKTITDPKGNVYTLTYDYELPTTDARYATKGNVVTITYPAIGTQIPKAQLTYNAYGQITKAVDPLSHITTYAYETATGYLATILRDLSGINAQTGFTYDAYGNLKTVTDANLHTTIYQFNALNQLVQVATPYGIRTKYTYDANGNVSKVERQANAAGTAWQTTSMTYTNLNQIEKVTDPLNRVTTYSYDLNGNLDSILNPDGTATIYTYDERNLLFKVSDANTPAGITQYDYDINGNLTKITDAKKQATSYIYDLNDRLDYLLYPDGKKEDVAYDKNGNLQSVILASANTIYFTYDALNRRIAKQFLSNSTRNVTYTYDLDSRLTDVNNITSQIHYAYDNLNRVDYTTQKVNGVSYKVDYTFDKAGHRTKLVYPSGKAVSYTYDNDNNLRTISLNSAALLTLYYDTLNRVISKSYGSANLPLSSYSYDMANQLAGITNKLGNAKAISTYNYPKYDPVGNRTQMTRAFGTGAATTKNYTYDYINELTNVTGAESGAYTYDGVGNRQTANGTAYVANNVNQYTKVGTAVYSYDANGNLKTDGVNTFAYDEDNNLLSATSTAAKTYAYDGFGRRVSKTVGGVTKYYIYDDDSIIAEYSSSKALEAEYVLSDNIDEVLLMERGGKSYYYHYDGLGSVSEITDTSGAVAEYYTYDAYGNTTIRNSSNTVLTTSGISNRFMFTGREYDSETGLYHYRARTYSPKLGRFLQRDPLGYWDSMNL